MSKKRPFFLSNEYLILSILIIIAIITRAYNLGVWEFWHDELHTLRHAYKINLISARPFPYLLPRLSFELFGVSEWSARLFPAIAGVVVIPFFFFSLKKITGIRTALLTLAFIVFSPWHLFYSQSARDYTFIFLTGGLSAFCFYYGIMANRNKFIIISIFIVLVGILTHSAVIFILPAYLLFVLIHFIPNSNVKKLRYFIIIIFAAFLIGSLLSPIAINFAKGWISVSLREGWKYSLPHFLLSIVNKLGVPVSVLVCITLLMLLYEGKNIGYFLLCYTMVPLVCMILLQHFMKVRQDYIFFTIPGYFLLAAIGCSRVYETLKDKQLILAIGFIGIMLTSNVPSFASHYSNGGRYPLKKAGEFIVNKMNPTDIFLSGTIGSPLYYFKIDVKGISYFSPEQLDEYMIQGKRIWLLLRNTRKGMISVDIYKKAEFKKWMSDNCRLVKEFTPTRYDYIDTTVRIFQCELCSESPK